MRNEKKLQRLQLEKFSKVFTQLGLVLVLFVVYVILEHESLVDKRDSPFVISQTGEELGSFVFTKEKPKAVKSKSIKKVKSIAVKQKQVFIPNSKIDKVDNDVPVKTTLILPTDSGIKATNESNTDEITTVVPNVTSNGNEGPPTVVMRNIQNAPVFKGCEGLSELEGRKCFENKIKQHVQRYFNGDLAQNLGLSPKKYRISTQFIIDDGGEIVDVKIRAPHKRIKKEVNRVINKVPKFVPGKQNNKPVKVRYTLPITFKVE